MVMRRFLGLSSDSSAADKTAPGAPETETVRRIVGELGQVEPERRRYLAGFAYVVSRAAHSDLDFSEDETRLMERIVVEIGKLPEAQAVLVVEIAKHQTEFYGGTEDYLVTREFAARATDEQRRAVVEACFAVVAADHTITSAEYAELTQISDELGLTRPELNAIRHEYKDHLAAIQKMRGLSPS
ncbi:MAG: TerB family tellurite resistance protein [Candidatus Limnocylindrales bacterium]